jgi:hypothetical protein
MHAIWKTHFKNLKGLQKAAWRLKRAISNDTLKTARAIVRRWLAAAKENEAKSVRDPMCIKLFMMELADVSYHYSALLRAHWRSRLNCSAEVAMPRKEASCKAS